MIIGKFTKNQYAQKMTIGYYCQKIFKYTQKYQNTNTIGAKICRK